VLLGREGYAIEVVWTVRYRKVASALLAWHDLQFATNDVFGHDVSFAPKALWMV